MKTKLPENTDNPQKAGCIKRLVRLHSAMLTAHDTLCEATKEAIPMGAIVSATVGKAKIQGEVIEYRSAWYAGSVMVRNAKSGKIWRVKPHDPAHCFLIISLPNAKRIHPHHQDAQ